MGGEVDENGCKQLKRKRSFDRITKKPLDLQTRWKSRGFTPAFIWNRAGSYHLISNVKKGDQPSYVASFLPSILADIPPKLLFTDFMKGHGMFALSLNPEQLHRLEDFFKVMHPSSLPQRQLLLPCIFRQITQYLKAGAAPICSSSRYGYIFQVLSMLERLKSEKLTS